VSTLVLVRHAEPVDDLRGRCYGSLDVDLSERGRTQARELAGRLTDPYSVVYASPRVRAVETAKPLAAARDVPVQIDERLREIDFGAFEGRRYDEIERAEPELFRAWMETPTQVRFPGGESFADVRERALAAFSDIRDAYECAVVVAHGGVIRAGLASWLGMPDEAIFRLAQRYCGISIVDWAGETPVVRLLNG
jgi:alpha-ribazole phosphatase/probable phosphoglycerate mutase